MLRFLPPMQQRRVSSKQHIEAMLKMSILAIFGLLLIGNGCLAEEQFTTKPDANSFAVIGGEFLFNWNYTTDPGVSAEVIQWYQSDALGNVQGVLVMRLITTLKILNANFIGRTIYVPNAGMLVKNITFSDEGYFTCYISYTNGHTHKDTMYLHVTIPPTIGLHLPNTSIVFINTRASWSCQFDARPAPTVKWYLNGNEVSSSRYTINTTTLGVFNNATRVYTTLTINASQPEDTGVIKCAAILPTGNISSSLNNIVYYPPQQTSFASNIPNVGDQGKRTTFTCSARGHPQISYQIYKDGSLLSNSTSGVYIIASTNFSDGGKYWCIPVNYLGEGPKVEFNFTIYVSPELQSQSDAAFETLVGSIITMHCSFRGLPAPSIRWRKIGGNISNTANISHTITTANGSYPVANSTLRFDSIGKADIGVYECVGTNPAGSLSRNISINVTYAPEFSKRLSPNYTLIEGQNKNVSWTCIASGNPSVTITWTVKGVAPGSGYSVDEKRIALVNGEQIESNLTMFSILRQKSSIIACNAVSSLGSVQSSSTIVINYPPTISQLMATILNITTGQSALLSCDVNSQPRSQVYWEKNGVLINASILTSRVVESNSYMTRLQSNLSINAANKSDEGSYKCVAVNSVGNVTQNAYIHVNYAPEFLTSLQRTSYTLEGTASYQLECVVRSKPLSSIIWTMNGTVIHHSNKTAIQFVHSNETIKGIILKATLTLNNLEKDDYANYVCTATNFVGSASSEQLLVITYKPLITASSDQITFINATKTIKLFCDFQSNPSASSLIWRLNNQPITASHHAVSNVTLMTSSKHTQQRSELTITNASRFDYGVYECEAANNIGSVKRNVTLVVYYSPLIVQSMDGEYIRVEGLSLTLACHFISNPKADLQWSFNSSTIDNSMNGYNVSTSTHTQIDRVASNTTLSIPNIRRTMQGYYRCDARNHQGITQKMVTVIVHYEPTFTSSPPAKEEVNTGQSTTIACHVNSNPVSNITWFKDGVLLQSNSNALISTSVTSADKFKAMVTSTLRLNVVNKNVTGNYSCRAANTVGVQSQESRVIAKYAPALTYNFAAQQNLTESQSMVKFACTAESHPASTIRWYKNGSPYTSNIMNETKLSEDSKTIIESSLVFPSGIKRTDFGRYTCNASNSVGSASFSSDVTVWYGPVFQSNLTGRLDITESNNASFQCTVEGYPEPSIAWRKNGVVLQSGKYAIGIMKTVSSENRVVLRSHINFTNVVDNDTATYACEATNVVRTMQQSKMLNVQYIPKLLVASSNVTVNQTDAVNLHCQTQSNPPVSRHIWTKGTQLSETGPILRIASADFSSTGKYSCVAVNSLGSSATLSFTLTVNIPPTFTKQADCKPNATSTKMVCECAGTGVPTPSVFWTKGTSSVIIGRGNIYEKSLASSDVDGKYNCHLKNLLQEITSSSGFYYNTKPFTDWSQWGECNVTCGGGYQTRARSCNFPPCDNNDLMVYRNCTGPCVAKQLAKDEVWAMVLYILIPIIVVLLLILLLWFVRTNRHKEEDFDLVVPVYGNLSKPPSTRSVPTKRDIYLPESNFGTVNSAYLVDAETPKKDDLFISVNEDDYENIEAQLNLDEEFPLDSSTDEQDEDKVPSPSTSPNEEYVQILPDDDSPSPPGDFYVDGNHESQPNAAENGPHGPHTFYNELVTAL